MKVLGLEIRMKPAIPFKKVRQIKILEKLQKGALRVASRLVTRSTTTVKSIYEVRPIEDGWMIAEKGSAVPLRIFVKKQEAIREARQMARENHTEVEVFNRNGSLQNHYSFST